MKKLISLCIFVGLIVVASFFSCKKSSDPIKSGEPVACIRASSVFSPSNQSITFQNCSANFASLFWDFGDGNTSSDIIAGHSYTQNGVYTVTLTAYLGAKTNTSTLQVVIANSAELNVDFNFGDWHLPADANKLYLRFDMYNSNNVQHPYSTLMSASYLRNGILPGQLALPVDLGSKESGSVFFIKLILGSYYTQNNVQKYKTIDSLITTKFSFSDSAQISSVNSVLSLVNASYVIYPPVLK